MNAALLVLLAAAAAQEGSSEAEVVNRAEVMNRTSVGVYGEAAQTVGQSAVELRIGESLRAVLHEKGDFSLKFNLAGRLGVRLGDMRLDRVRVRALNLQLEGERWQVDLGRFSPLGGGWRLVDGAQGLFEVGGNVRVGAWGGLSPDPYNTAISARYGGGPVLSWRNPRAELTVLGEFLGSSFGFDRASGVVSGRYEPSKVLDLRAHLDLQAGGADRPVSPADAELQVRIDPVDDLRIDTFYNAYSSLAFLSTEQLDPGITRFAALSQALSGEPWVPQDVMDPSVYHLVGASLSWRPPVGSDGIARLRLEGHGRYRHHEQADRRYARGTVTAGLGSLAADRLDVGLTQSVLWWGQRAGSETSVNVWFTPDKQRTLSLDTSVQMSWKALQGTELWAPSVYADAFVDWLLPRGFTVSVGYSFTNSAELDAWDTYHGFLGRVGWTLRTRERAKASTREKG